MKDYAQTASYEAQMEKASADGNAELYVRSCDALGIVPKNIPLYFRGLALSEYEKLVGGRQLGSSSRARQSSREGLDDSFN